MRKVKFNLTVLTELVGNAINTVRVEGRRK